jgi:small subunit ribosomal protein S9
MAVKPAYEKKQEGRKQVADIPKEPKAKEKPPEKKEKKPKVHEAPKEKHIEKAKPKKAQEKKPEQKKEAKKPQSVFTTGKRKKAVARAKFVAGKGSVKVNGKPIELYDSEILRLRMMEPLMLAGDAAKSYDIRVNVRGGGPMGQADAARQAIARGLVELVGGNLKQVYMSYDRNLLVFDPRRTEPHKPPRSSQGPRRYKQRSKR